MKKLLLSVSLTAALCLSANAQEAFKHLSMGIELGTTGIGAELNLPVVSDHLVLKAGATFPNISVSYTNSSFDISGFSATANEYISDANEYLASIHGETGKFTTIPSTTKLEADGKFNCVSYKAILEYYPTKKSSFHINVGIYGGNGQFASVNGNVEDLWNIYEADVQLANSYAEKYPDFKEYVGQIPALEGNIRDKTYQIKSPGTMNIDLAIAKVRPYFGFGFGRSIPQKRCGFQFDLGAVYLGKGVFSSENEVTYNPSANEIDIKGTAVEKVINYFENIRVYPVMNFRFILRLF